MQPNRAPRTAILALLLWTVSASTFGQARANEDFPLTQGTFWIYQGFVRSWLRGSTTGKITRVTWKTEVTKVVVRGSLTLAVVKGMPGDLDWSEGNQAPQLSILVRTRDAKFYLIEGDEVKSVLAQLDNLEYSWEELPVDDDWFLELPLAKGKKFCGADGMRRTDNSYCWVTGPPHQVALADVKGIPSGKHWAFRVEYFTNPDDEEFDFVPGVGMVTYGYHHHGSIADTELHLVEFHDGGLAR